MDQFIHLNLYKWTLKRRNTAQATLLTFLLTADCFLTWRNQNLRPKSPNVKHVEHISITFPLTVETKHKKMVLPGKRNTVLSHFLVKYHLLLMHEGQQPSRQSELLKEKFSMLATGPTVHQGRISMRTIESLAYLAHLDKTGREGQLRVWTGCTSVMIFQPVFKLL